MTDPRIAAARDYIQRGYRIVPLRGKRPFRRDWPDHPLTLDDEHDGNIGILLTDEQRMLLVDVDCKNGAPGLDTLESWRCICSDFDREPDQITPSGGRHYLLRIPVGVDTSTLPNGSAAPGIDVLRDRKQFVVAPSFTEQGAYVGSLPWSPYDVPLMSPELVAHLQTRPQLVAERSEPDRAPSLDLVREAVRRIPNKEDTTRDEYVRMALLIRGAVGPEHEAEGMELFDEWAARWPGGNDPAENARVYETARPKGGWHALCQQAGMEAEEARAAFEAVPVAVKPPTPYTLRQARDLHALPRPQWLVEDLVLERSQVMIFGQSGAGKSFCNLHLACCIAGGLPFHGRPVKQGAAVIVLLEGYEDYRRRLPAQLRELGLPEDAPVYLIDGNEQGKPRFRLKDPDARQALIDTLRPLQPVYVSIDTAARATAGLDENSNSDESVVLECLDRIQQEIGSAVGLVHHAGWSNDHARGASARRAGMDLELHLMRSGTRKLELKVTKARSARDGYSFHAELVSVVLTQETTLVYRPVTAAQVALSQDDRLHAILDELADHAPDGLTRDRLAVQCDMKKKDGKIVSTFNKDLKTLREQGLISAEGTKARKKYHIIPAGLAALQEWKQRAAQDAVLGEEHVTDGRESA
jgi:hypothetical protein